MLKEELQKLLIRIVERRHGRVEQLTNYSLVATFPSQELARLASLDLAQNHIDDNVVSASLDKVLRVYSKGA